MKAIYKGFKPYFRIQFLLFFAILFIGQAAFAQEIGFKEEVAGLVENLDQQGWEKGGIVFTGSSSIRFWKTLAEDFPKTNTINTGFGGSQAHELLHYLEPLVIRFAPRKVFIYIGENDINAGKSVRQTMTEISLIIDRLQSELLDVELYFIGTKPSPSRWEKSGQMQALNAELNTMALSKDNVYYISIWDKMLDKKGQPKETLFVEDRLHMNEKGYKIWRKSVKGFL
ncbi:GDSL-type esterase/lipase family protein [Mariniradius sediminis]|uniref:GDSL-type esterase/lipase family protein n=1 Tax=Mariniradius sediminis TaxID=2909237 RepID=A0ABS9BSU0_9BACT|nr:GDSL-type esterase/lipase family protein [Mariniradius sediminis]MCF1750757.1 GDSL-type esterase/lipase family protein [Mariniradius sediminis]